ncbi:hypothetical protein J6590_106160 [Homalodisca vitripennis]|nr:hypothetical protein J6590_106160 [Homalodisca vitripennis]
MPPIGGGRTRREASRPPIGGTRSECVKRDDGWIGWNSLRFEGFSMGNSESVSLPALTDRAGTKLTSVSSKVTWVRYCSFPFF